MHLDNPMDVNPPSFFRLSVAQMFHATAAGYIRKFKMALNHC
jgi:hypothetical protein